MNTQVIHLKSLTGEQFEEVVRMLFERRGYSAKTTAATGDEGRDIIASRDGQVLVIECKHQRQAVGRPVIQKLHSAALTMNADEALLVASGEVSQHAHQYARRSTNGFVKIWAHEDLVMEARKVGIYLVGDKGADDSASTVYFQIPPASQTPEVVCRRKFEPSLHSYPRPIASAITFHHLVPRWISTVWVEYRVDKVFRTQAGVIYKAATSGTSIFLDGKPQEGGLGRWISQLEPELVTHLEHSEIQKALNQLPPLSPFEDRVRYEVSSKLSRVVHYRGANNVSYAKQCTVRSSDVMTSVRYVLVHTVAGAITTGPKSHNISVVDSNRDIYVISEQGWRLPAILCNDCGHISSAPRKSNELICGLCQRTLCSKHVWRSSPLFLQFKSRIRCSACFAKEIAAGKKKLLTSEVFLSGAIATIMASITYAVALSLATSEGEILISVIAGFGIGSIISAVSFVRHNRTLRGAHGKALDYRPMWDLKQFSTPATPSRPQSEIADQQAESRVIRRCPKCGTGVRLPVGRYGSVKCPTCATLYRART